MVWNQEELSGLEPQSNVVYHDKLKEYENERWDKEVQSYQRLMGTSVKNSYHSPEQHERIYGVVGGF